MLKERWASLSKAQQMGNIGSELARAGHWELKKDMEKRDSALERALELLDYTLDDRRWKAGVREIARFREVVAAWFCGDSRYELSPGVLEAYCTAYVINNSR